MTRRTFTPHPYQRIAVDHMLDRPRCALWAGMGLGKTVSTLTALDSLFLAGESAPALVLAPLRVARSTWPREVAKWDHLRHINVAPIIGSEQERRFALKHDVSVYTCNYENLPWLVEHFGDRWPFRTIIADEATRLKSFRLRQGGQRARYLGRVAHRYAKHFFELTGTPSPNGLADLWGQLWFLDQGQRLGRSFDAFRQRWFQKSFDGFSMDALPNAQEEIHARIADLCLTIDAKDWFDIDAPIRKTIYVDLPVKARKHYKEMEKQMFTEIDGHGVEATHAAAKTMKCLQLASGFAWVDTAAGKWSGTHDEKLDALASIVEEANGAPILVEYHWVPSREQILRTFPKARFLSNDPKIEDDWNAGKIPMLVANAASAGHGLNLQDGGYILARYDHWWDLEQYDQILERIGPVRQTQAGHPRAVFDYHIVARDTVDELVMSRRESKRSVQDILLDAMKRKH